MRVKGPYLPPRKTIVITYQTMYRNVIFVILFRLRVKVGVLFYPWNGGKSIIREKLDIADLCFLYLCFGPTQRVLLTQKELKRGHPYMSNKTNRRENFFCAATCKQCWWLHIHLGNVCFGQNETQAGCLFLGMTLILIFLQQYASSVCCYRCGGLRLWKWLCPSTSDDNMLLDL